MSEIEISLFPIPGSVTFPYSVTSLHVFEPRYRTMIRDSIAARRRIGVAHTQRTLSSKKMRPNEAPETALHRNQESYLSHAIFSAGFAEIQQTLPDGRLLVEIEMDCRYKIKDEIQQIPYKIVTCEPFVDEAESNDTSIRENLDQILMGLTDENGANLKLFLQSDEWKNLSFDEYSFKIYSIIRFEPNILQNILELRSPHKRIQFLLDILTRGQIQ